MGHDLIAIARHRMDTTSPATAAAELARRMNVTVSYGYTITEVVGTGATKMYQEMQEITEGVCKAGGNANYVLNWRDLFVYNSINDAPDSNGGVDWDFYDPANHDDTEMRIMREAFEPPVCWASRWWSFCRLFTGESLLSDQLEYLNSYRREVKQYTTMLGGDAALYVDDQGKSAGLIYSPATQSWEELVEEAKSVAGDNFIHVSDWLIQHQKGGQAAREYPLAYYDDFADLDG